MTPPGPSFIGAGFSRCGTTSLYAYFRSHPDMWMPPLKEITYWDLERHRGRRAPRRSARIRFAARRTLRRDRGVGHQVRDARFLARYCLLAPNDTWYRRLFAPAAGRCTGDLSPSYMRLDDHEVRVLHRTLPDTKVFFMVRDPFERAWSNTKKALARAHHRSIDAVPDDEIEAYLTDDWFLANCDYATPLHRWEAVLPPDRLFVGFTVDLDERPDDLLGRLADFIDVDPAPLIDAQRRNAREFTTTLYGGTIPDRWERFLAPYLEPMLATLADDLGGYAIDWHERARRAMRRSAVEARPAAHRAR